MMFFHSINFNIVGDEQAVLPAKDIGFRRGFAAFDYLRLLHGRPLFLGDHLDRLENSAAMLGLALPCSRAELIDHIQELVAKNQVGVIQRGCGSV